jgi:flagellar biosynthetic protein FliQ
MQAEAVMTIAYKAMLLTFSMAAPVLLITLAVGLIVSIFQAATQINEMTLSFIPKLLAVGVTLVLLGPWMLSEMVDYIRALFDSLPQMAM